MSNKKREFLPYEEAKKVVNALGLKNDDDWRRWSCTERPLNIPSNPQRSYKNAGWNGLADWLGTAFLPFEEARKKVHALGLKTYDDWFRWSCTERSPDIPSKPWKIYKNSGWNGLADWLGKPLKERKYLPYEEARKKVHAVGLKGWDDWERWSRTERPSNIPSHPNRTYKNAGWNGINDWIEDERWADNLM